MLFQRRHLLIIAFTLATVLGGGLFLHPSDAPPIRIGVLHSLTGTMSMNERPLVDAVRLAVEKINAAARRDRVRVDGQFDLVWSSGELLRPPPFLDYHSRFEWQQPLEERFGATP